MKKLLAIFVSVVLVAVMFGETPEDSTIKNETINTEIQDVITENEIQGTLPPENTEITSTEEKQEIDFSEIRENALANIPAYSSKAYAVINNNVPFFNDSDLTTKSYEEYGRLDLLGRCTEVSASVGKDLMPTEERGNIGMIKPTGWHTVKYQGIDGNYLYNRCHLIGFQLTGENANERNLITGTRYMNVQGMLPFENMIADYVKETNNHVLYRVTPIFEGANLLASGVLMEAKSVEDDGKGVMFNVYCYNVQPGVEINYATGASTGPEFTGSTTTTTTEKTQQTTPVVTPVVVPTIPKKEQKQENSDTPTVPEQKEETPVVSQNQISYVANKNTKKFHYSDCSSVKQMSDKNKVYITATSEEMREKGYSPCGNCNP